MKRNVKRWRVVEWNGPIYPVYDTGSPGDPPIRADEEVVRYSDYEALEARVQGLETVIACGEGYIETYKNQRSEIKRLRERNEALEEVLAQEGITVGVPKSAGGDDVPDSAE